MGRLSVFLLVSYIFCAWCQGCRNLILDRSKNAKLDKTVRSAVIGYVSIAAATAMNLSDMPVLRALLAIAGTIATIALAMLLSSSPAKSFVSFIGRLSLEIYVAHVISLQRRE